MYSVAVVAGVIATLPVHATRAASSTGRPHHHAAAQVADSPARSGLAPVLGSWGWWMVMVLAMMLPVVAPLARHIALRSLWARRQRAIAWFLLGYLAVWAVVGALLVGLLAAIRRPHPPPAMLVPILVAAAMWQVSRPRRRVLRRCETPRPAAVRAWAADRACVTAGWRAALRCTFTCGPAMLAMAITHNPLLMGSLLALLLSERARGPNPDRRAGRPHEALGLLACAAVVALLAR
jgi:predicted metal-binding membrane protein